MIKKVFTDSLIYTVPAFLNRGLAVFLVPLYTRVLSPEDYGSLDMLVLFASLAGLTVPFEITQGVARFYSTENNPQQKVRYASTAFWFSFFCYSLFLALTFLCADTLSVFIMGRADLISTFRTGMFYIWSNGMFYLIGNQFRWELRSRHYAFASMISTIVTASLSVYLTFFLHQGLLGLLRGMLGGALAASLYGIWKLKTSFRFTFSVACLKQMLHFSAPLVPSGIAVFVSHYIDRLMINYFLTLSDLGVYGIGYRLSSIVGLIMVGFQGALTPMIYTNYKLPDTPNNIYKIFRIFLFFALLLFFGVTVFARELLFLFTTPAYYSASKVVIFLVPSILISNMIIFTPGIGIAKKTYIVIWINVCGALLNTFLNIIFIPLFGILGAGVATLLGYIFVFACYMYFSQKFYPVTYNWKILFSAISIALICVLIGRSVSLGMWLNILANCILCIILTYILVRIRLITKDEIFTAGQEMRCLFKKKPL